MDIRIEHVWYLIPDCCKHKTCVVVYAYSKSIDEKPKWYVKKQACDIFSEPSAIEVSHCPTCGTKLPDFVKRTKITQKMCKPDKWGNHCETCKKRISYCTCKAWWHAWKQIKAENNVPPKSD